MIFNVTRRLIICAYIKENKDFSFTIYRKYPFFRPLKFRLKIFRLEIISNCLTFLNYFQFIIIITGIYYGSNSSRSEYFGVCAPVLNIVIKKYLMWNFFCSGTIFMYKFSDKSAVRKYFHNEKKANYGTMSVKTR